MWRLLHKNNKSPFRIIIFGFLLVIFMGSFLLMLPVSTKTGECTPFLDALFTSTSAVCVTVLALSRKSHFGCSRNRQFELR